MPKKIYGKSKRKQAPTKPKKKKESLGKKVAKKATSAIARRNAAIRAAAKG